MTIDAAKARELWADRKVSRSMVLSWAAQGLLTQQQCDDILASEGGMKI